MDLEILAFAAGLIGSTATVPQLYKMLKTKEVDGVSTHMFMMKNSAYVLWMAFGFMSGTYAIVFWNLFALTLSSAAVFLKFRIKSRARKSAQVIDFRPYEHIENELQQAVKPHLRLVYSRSN